MTGKIKLSSNAMANPFFIKIVTEKSLNKLSSAARRGVKYSILPWAPELYVLINYHVLF